MNKPLSKFIVVAFLLLSARLHYNLYAQEMKDQRKISNLQVLTALSHDDRYGHYDYMEIFLDSNNCPVIMSAFGLKDKGEHMQKISIFAYNEVLQNWELIESPE